MLMPKPYNWKVEQKRGREESQTKTEAKKPTIFKNSTWKLARKITVDRSRILLQLAF